MYVAIWRFLPAAGREAEFVRAYAADGTWAALFARADGYVGTELLAASDGSGEYLTIDRWRSVGEYGAFRTRFAAEYAALDRTCESLTARETEVGHFEAHE